MSGGLPIRQRSKIGKLLSLEFLDERDLVIIEKLGFACGGLHLEMRDVYAAADHSRFRR